MSEPLVYEASVYTRTVNYKNLNGETKIAKLYFALDPVELMGVMATYIPKKIKSGNPALNGKDAEMSDEQQILMVRQLAIKSAGIPSEDGESWTPFENFGNHIAGKAFLTKLVSSDADRKEFSEKVILDPFRAFSNYFMADESNSEVEKKELKDMLAKIENIFTVPAPGIETSEERATRLKAELAALEIAEQN